MSLLNIRGLLKENVTKTIHETRVAHLSEPDVEGDLIHTLKESLTVSQTTCFVFIYKTAVVSGSWYFGRICKACHILIQLNILMQLNKNISINVPAHLKGI